MLGSQVWFILYLNHPDKLENVPFVVYSSKSPEEVEQYVQDIKDQDQEIKNLIERNYLGHIQKDFGAENRLLDKINNTLK